MIQKQNIRYYIILAFISILIYKIIDTPNDFILGIKSLISFFSPFLIGILLSLLLNPIVMFFENKFKLNRLLNIFTAYILLLLLVVLGFKLFIPTIIKTLNILIKELPNYIELINILLKRFIENGDLPNGIISHIQNSLNSILNSLIDIFSNISSELLVYILSITSVVFNFIMGIILSLYMLYDKEKLGYSIKKLLYACLPDKYANGLISLTKTAHDIFYHYLIGQLIDASIVGVISFLVFKFILQIENSLFLSFIIFITNMIPYFGPFIGAVPPILMTLIYNPIKAIWVAVFIIILQQLDGNFISPKIMGTQVGIDPIWIISSVLIGGSLFGFIGIFLSIPTAALIKTYLTKYIQKKQI